MSIEKFNNFRLFYHLIGTDCQHEENFDFLLGHLFNIEGDLILSEVDQINLSHRTCQNWKNFIYIDFEKLFTVEQIRKLYDGICSGEKEQQQA